MKGLKGLYICLILIMFINLINFTWLGDDYAGITMFANVILFLIATLFFINASHRLKKAEQ
ncbi:hypothetical protein [Planococcus sp. CAU13]|uniref:hypothetical protein n=1 Tax=Planococcus sp. CAU13 TaxID=1541197 RepID=UPI00052FFA4D|nr:hypothetical protein [Planococcus sp. CAU13]